MRTHGKILWTPRGEPRQHAEFGPQRDDGLCPRSLQFLSPRDEAVFLLHVAAEIEHALMVQYLFAAFSFGPPLQLPANQRVWVDSIKHIARQEMGHLMTVQNLILALGGAINFEREDYPFRSDFYPFPFSLERPTKDVFAKYVVAEMPPPESLATLPADRRRLSHAATVRAAATSGGQPINRVGALYACIQELVETLDVADFTFGTAETFQAFPGDVGGEGPSSPDPMNSIMVWTIDSKNRAKDALRLIATQGEGTTQPTPNSHFDRFLTIFDGFPETNPVFGQVQPNPTRPVPTNPRLGVDSTPFNVDTITEPIASLLGHFANLRYRVVLDGLTHYLTIDRSIRPNCKMILGPWVVHEMPNTITRISVALTSLLRQDPPIFVDGAPAVAAAPFELPYTLSLSPDSSSRWLKHIDLLATSALLAQQIMTNPACPSDLAQTLDDILITDQDSIASMTAAAANPSSDCSL